MQASYMWAEEEPGTRGAEDPTEIPCVQNPAHNQSLGSLSKWMALKPNQTI